jgi:mRNA-degrading endonuclease toxin of MazEF toxin-antitoxin module
MNRGDIVIAPFPFQDQPGEKLRPALIVQHDRENRRLQNTILVMITGNLKDAGQPTTYLIDPSQPNGTGSGLAGRSLVKCHNLVTIRQQRIIQVIGSLSDKVMQAINDCLRATFDLS